MEGLADFLRLDTVSQQADRVRAGAAWLSRAMRARGLEARVLETGGNPAVFGALPAPGAERTLLIYCHYDVKPAPPAGARRPGAGGGPPPAPCPATSSTAVAPPMTRGRSGRTSPRSS